jgi:hypothetical protein
VRLKEARRLAKVLTGADGTAVPLVHPLRWPGSWHRKEEPRLARIVAYNPDCQIELVHALDTLREAVDAMGQHQPEERGVTAEPGADPLDIVAALAIIPNGDLPWDEWNRIGMATWRASGGSETGYAAFAAWSVKSGKYSAPETRARWDHYVSSPPTDIGAGTLFYYARQHRPDWRKPTSLAKRALDDDGPSPSALDPEPSLAGASGVICNAPSHSDGPPLEAREPWSSTSRS